MPTLTMMLTLYYLCDQAAATRGLSLGPARACMTNYEALKLEFIDEPLADPGTAERAGQIRLGYVGLKAWEAANPEAVAQMRRAARQRLSQM